MPSASVVVSGTERDPITLPFPLECEVRACAIGAALDASTPDTYAVAHDGIRTDIPRVGDLRWQIGIWVNQFHPAMRVDVAIPDSCRVAPACDPPSTVVHDFAAGTLITTHGDEKDWTISDYASRADLAAAVGEWFEGHHE